ncbi:GNAT family N-acetyltransferase [Reinekea sp. G2M2-21]|uniref:GNAT family N-acetyltransferase n=1 Tax=Reinekea sp. G2M2-21 TaxID=2788942 RepID=UPI0018AA5CFD|nr:GNAT family N-acetyltransferase [Reinekea sp. G2M2-21]
MIRTVQIQDLERCHLIERTAYAGDEAATQEKIAVRIQRYPAGFIVMEVGGIVVGFINGGATFEVQLSDSAFKELVGHDENGPHVVIMSVAVHPDFQRRGYASQLMSDFIRRMQDMRKQSIHLVCQAHLIPFYESFGYQVIGESSANYGGLSWHDMRLDLPVIGNPSD